jgi:four helix bundle protein
MAQTFEDLNVWQDSRVLTAKIYGLSGNIKFSKDFGLAGQIQRAAVSVMSNIAEGFARGSNKEFIQFLFISKGSLAEVNSQLYVALDLKYITKDEFDEMNISAKNLAKRLVALIKRMDSTMKIKQST